MWRSPYIPMTSAISISSDGTPFCRSLDGAARSSSMHIPIRRKAPAPSRSPPRMTSTILDFKTNIADQFIFEPDKTIADFDREDRFIGRKRIVAALELRNLVEKVETHSHTVPHGDRSGVIIEPYLT